MPLSIFFILIGYVANDSVGSIEDIVGVNVGVSDIVGVNVGVSDIVGVIVLVNEGVTIGLE